MKKIKPFLPLLLILGVIYFGSVSLKNDASKKPEKPISPLHKCIDSTHQTCDGLCECDGMACTENQ